VIPAAALLVLLGLGLFVGGVVTGATVLYWACVAACVAAGVCLVLARVRMGRAPAQPARSAGTTARTPQRPPATPAGSTGASAAGATAPESAPEAEPAVDAPTPAPPAWEPPPSAPPTWQQPAPPAWEPAAAPLGDPAVPPLGGPAPPGLPAPEPAPPFEPPSTAAHARRGHAGGADAGGDPPVEEVEVTDLLLVVDLRDDVLVVDEHPRYHLPGCRWLAGRETVPLPLDEARTDGFTPCAWCEPDRTLAQRERARRAGRRAD
jgi:hypothetical protein